MPYLRLILCLWAIIILMVLLLLLGLFLLLFHPIL